MFWSLRVSEFVALRKVYEAPIKRWAADRATFHNAHFQTDGAPWLAEDFLGGGNRQARIEQAKKDQREVEMLNMKLAQIQMNRGKEAKGIPFWARETWDGSIPEEARHA